MKHTRRDVLRLAALAGASAAALPPWALALESPPELAARVARLQMLPDTYPQTEVWGYEGAIPGPEIRVRQGERVRRRFANALPQGSSVHWHGIRIDNAMDGVAGLTQEAVAPGDTIDYDFVAPDAGTYWYHAHNRSWEQVARGLHGALVVEEAEAPDVDREEVLVLDDWLLNPDTGQIDDSFDHPMMMSHAGRTGNFVTTNGRYDLSLAVKRNERLRLRLINASNARIFPLMLAGLKGWVVALDGMPLPAPSPAEEVLVLAPAQRIDLIVDVTAAEGEDAQLIRIGGDDQPVVQAAFPVSGAASVSRRGAPASLPPNPGMEAPDLAAARPLRLVMAGGAMGRLQSAVLNGERKSFRELAASGRFWAFNDMAEMGDTPLADLGLGEPVRLEIVNDTVFPHAMHLHGMHFREVSSDGGLGPLRDTVLVGATETREIAFAADNPGNWLFHCHMLSHAASGMMTWVRVS
ncbi:multicopper oxidase family protein [Psychromarinibacter sp. C21-152]|uniref:Multicopper oxidase family protein n=1 Tax=Psychromarinibacter sediminicola TaxID=3033385 RepID=A0AAE3NXB5_9RHOB|nr:multicopper oxidase family protein [Psychromarinibacter sediminicola]MDF0603374.1 multicopper oxidase family protein [Psychromarinibacter sediminicola]